MFFEFFWKNADKSIDILPRVVYNLIIYNNGIMPHLVFNGSDFI